MTVPVRLVAAVANRRALVESAAFACLVELLPGVPGPMRTLAGLWLLIGAPTVVWKDVAARVVSTPDAGVLLALGFAIAGDMVVALLVNTALPHLGVGQPLGRPWLAVGSAVLVVIVGLLPRRAHPRTAGRWWRPPGGRAPRRGLCEVLAMGAVTLALSVAGAIRLNNGLGSTVSFLALLSIAELLLLLMVRRRRYPAAVLEMGLFIAAAGLLLLTSLRGWSVSGHDIQREFLVFQLSSDAGRWNIADYRDSYNACLSITLLPISLARLTAIPGAYVFKAVLPLLFAVTPVLVYRSVRNVAPQLVALLSAVYFMVFPTFFTDMTFMARQEIAFVLLGCAMVVLTDGGRSLLRRRIAFVLLGCGIVLSHYSTTYVVVATLVLVLGMDLGWRLLARWRARRRPSDPVPAGFVTWWMVAAIAAAAVAWTGPLTHTSGQLDSTLTGTVRDLADGTNKQSGSSDASYSLIGGARVSAEQRLTAYHAETERRTAAARAAGAYPPLPVVDSYAIRAVEEPAIPLTSLGRVLARHGIPVAAMNGFLRQWAARLLQLLLLTGVIVTVARVRGVFRASRDQLTLTVAMVGVIGIFTVLPQLSVDYGLLRAFQQGLFFFAPFIAAGSVWLCRWLGRSRAMAACAVALLFFLDLTGAVPRLLGGYPPQLHLDNAGQYYDLYYVQPQERYAIAWLRGRTATDIRAHIPFQVQSDRYSLSRLELRITGLSDDDIYPMIVGADSYVFLGPTMVRKREATVFYRGDLVTYRYPIAFLDATKDKLYSSDEAEIYR